jgi:hypothetical protein
MPRETRANRKRRQGKIGSRERGPDRKIMKEYEKILQENGREEKEFSENEMSRLRTWISKSRQGKDFPQD